jgi:hypothetical protein
MARGTQHGRNLGGRLERAVVRAGRAAAEVTRILGEIPWYIGRPEHALPAGHAVIAHARCR